MVLETRRGDHRAELTVGPDDYSYSTWHCCPRNASDKGISLLSCVADTNCVGLTCIPWVANIDIVATTSEIKSSFSAHCDVVTPGGVVEQCGAAVSRIILSGGGVVQRLITVGRIGAGCRITIKSLKASGCVAVPG